MATKPAQRKPKASDYPWPPTRPLRVFAFDPSVGRMLGNYMTLQLPFEHLRPGPVAEESRIAVIDYDASNNRYYEPVDLNDLRLVMGDGLTPSESDPCFHQQMVYAVVRETKRRFEYALGRPVKWRRPRGNRGSLRGYLRIFPHAFQQANAFYDSDHIALLFGYFESSGENNDTLPGQTIFTCLSYDIIAHEATHALIDGIREHFSEATSADTLAFHEAFSDIVALFQHFSIEDALLETIRRTGGLIHRTVLKAEVESDGMPIIGAELDEHNPLVGLARQFGEAMGRRAALRSALGTRPHAKDIEREFEPHRRGAILVAAIFDAFFSIYIRRVRDLLRLARESGQATEVGDLHPDLAARLAKEAAKTAQHFLTICIRSLDYCPPVDIQFGEFLRALITADMDLVPNDPWGYRTEIVKAFRLRGIKPEDVGSYSEDALRWRTPAQRGRGKLGRLSGLHYDVFANHDPSDGEHQAQMKKTAQLLHRFANDHQRQLGLAANIPIQTFSFHPILRIRPDGGLMVNYVVEFIQTRRNVVLDSDTPHIKTDFRGGSTVIFGQGGDVRYVIDKNIASDTRLRRRREFEEEVGERSAFRTFRPDERDAKTFAMVHRGY